MRVKAIKTPVFKKGDDLLAFVATHVKNLHDGDVLVVASKVVALAEGRVASKDELDTLVRSESEWSMKVRHGHVSLKDGLLMWNAGIDASNANGGIVLLPKDSFATAAALRRALMRRFGIKKLGVIVSDSRVMPLRAGVVGVALGYAGFRGLRDYRGKKDIFGKKYEVTRTDVADSLATAATLVMGEGAERQPLTVISDAPVFFTASMSRSELRIRPQDDMHGPLFRFPRRRG